MVDAEISLRELLVAGTDTEGMATGGTGTPEMLLIEGVITGKVGPV